MKIFGKDLKHGYVKLKIAGQDDLWHLSQLIDSGDIVSGETERKIKIGSAENSVRKRFFVEIKVEKIEYSDGTKQLRILGTTQNEIEEIPKGSHQTIEAEEGSVISIKKPQWFKFQLERLDEASSESFSDVLVCVLDRESAIIAILKSHGYQVLVELNGEVAKKYEGSFGSKEFYPDVVKKLIEYNNRFELSSIIIASPAFWKEELLKEIKDDALRRKIRMATVNTVDKNGLEEVLKRPELKSVLKEDRSAKEANLIEELLKEIATQGVATYGEKEVEKMSDMGAIRVLLVTSEYITKKRETSAFRATDQLMRKVDSMSGEIFILNSKNDKRLDALGGIAALLRFKASY